MGIDDLRQCRQKPDESMRSYVSRFTKILNAAVNVSVDRAIDVFNDGIRRETHIEELGRRKPKTITELMEIANGWADGEDHARRSRPRSDDDDDSRRHKDSSKRRDYGEDRRKKRRDDRRDDVKHIAAGYPDRHDDRVDNRRDDHRDDRRDPRKDDRRGGPSNNRREPMNWAPRIANLPPSEQVNAPCYLHTYIDPVDNQKKSSHLLRDCR